MTVLTIQDLISNAQQSMNEAEGQQYTTAAADLLEAIADLKCFSDEQIIKGMASLSENEVDTIKEHGIRLFKLLRISHTIYVGRRVAKGIIAGTRITEGYQEGLVAGPDFYQWQRVEEIEL